MDIGENMAYWSATRRRSAPGDHRQQTVNQRSSGEEASRSGDLSLCDSRIRAAGERRRFERLAGHKVGDDA